MEDGVYITGLGVISSLGEGIEQTLNAILAERSGISSIRYLHTSHTDLPVGEVGMSNSELAVKLNLSYPESELRTVMLGIIAGKEAVKSASLNEDDFRRTAFINGTTVGGMDMTEQAFGKVFASEANCPEVKDMKYNDCGCSTELIAKVLGKFKTMSTISTACSSAANAVIFGANLIKAGVVDIAVVGGAEALTRFHVNGFNTLMILDHEQCKPFDQNHCGINLGEGAAYIVIESEKSMHRRGVKPYAMLKGFANTCDAFHQTATSYNGEGPYLSMRNAMDMAGLSPEDIDYVNTHGTGTPNNDSSELTSMKRLWTTKCPRYSSTKAFTGHTTSASGAIEAVICLLAIKHSFIPTSLGCTVPMDMLYKPVMETIKDIPLRNVLMNSFGFGGNDTSIVFTATAN